MDEGRVYGGIDIGGTKIVAAIGRGDGEVIASASFATASDPDLALGQCWGWIESQADASAIESVGVACPGPYDRSERQMLNPPNMPGWHGLRIGEWFDRRVPKPVRIMNDANAGAYAEWLWGGHGTAGVLVFLTMSTGMGGGIVHEGVVLEGTHGFAGEIGRIHLDREGPVGFGERGTVEGFLSGPGIIQDAVSERLACEQRGEPSGLIGTNPLDVRAVCGLARAGDAAAQRVVDRVNARLGQLLAVLGNVLEPDVVVLGTIAAAHPDLFLMPARRAARAGMIPAVHDRMQVVASTLEARAVKQALAVAVLADRGHAQQGRG